MDEHQLVRDCLKGNREAQKQLYERFARRMLGVCYRYACSMPEAEDFLQESFIQVFRKLSQYRNQGHLEGWIYRVVVNTCLNAIKSRLHIEEKLNLPLSANLEMNELTHTTDHSNELMELVHNLPLGYKTVFNLYAIEGYSHDEIAGLLGIRASTSRSQYSRAREILQNRLNAGSNKMKNDG